MSPFIGSLVTDVGDSIAGISSEPLVNSCVGIFAVAGLSDVFSDETDDSESWPPFPSYSATSLISPSS